MRRGHAIGVLAAAAAIASRPGSRRATAAATGSVIPRSGYRIRTSWTGRLLSSARGFTSSLLAACPTSSRS